MAPFTSLVPNRPSCTTPRLFLGAQSDPELRDVVVRLYSFSPLVGLWFWRQRDGTEAIILLLLSVCHGTPFLIADYDPTQNKGTAQSMSCKQLIYGNIWKNLELYCFNHFPACSEIKKHVIPNPEVFLMMTFVSLSTTLALVTWLEVVYWSWLPV